MVGRGGKNLLEGKRYGDLWKSYNDVSLIWSSMN